MVSVDPFAAFSNLRPDTAPRLRTHNLADSSESYALLSPRLSSGRRSFESERTQRQPVDDRRNGLEASLGARDHVERLERDDGVQNVRQHPLVGRDRPLVDS